MTDSMIERVARAIKAATDKFDAPVRYYVEPEAARRWREANPDHDDESPVFDELASYRIIARAAIKAMRIPREPAFVQDIAHHVFNEMIDAALNEKART